MNILVLNCGSSSIKFQLIDTDDKKLEKGAEKVLAKGLVENIGTATAKVHMKPFHGNETELVAPIYEHSLGISKIIELLCDEDKGVIKKIEEIKAIGHRVVHGGELFSSSVVIDNAVQKGIKDCFDLAPLHNPANLMGYEAAKKVLPLVKQVAVFDTSFHQTMPNYAFNYALPYSLYEKYKIRKYGFHGTSHRFVSWKIAKILKKDLSNMKVITCHLGNGSSLTAINKGKSIDTTMGFTPLAGFLMGTRCGDIDPAIVTYLLEKENLRVEEINNMMNKHSGLTGVSGLSNDMRKLEAAMNDGDERAKLAVEMLAYSIKKFLGSYMAAMNGADVIIFTAGIGENSPMLRAKICENMDFFGIKLDEKINKGIRSEEACISAADSKVKVYVVPTNEELLIARDTFQCIK